MPDLSPAPSHKKVIATALGASVALHLIVAGALLVKLPVPSEAAPEEEIVQVEIVPPPEEEKPEPVEEAKKPDALKLKEEAKAEEPPPEKPPEQKPQEDPLEDPVISASKASAPEAAPPPSPAQDEQPEETKPPEPQPPKPEEPKPEEPQPQEKPPEEKAPEEVKEPEAPQKAEQPAPPPPPASQTPAEEEKQASAPPMSALRPVFQFGEKDSGPRQALDGNAAEDTPAPAATDADPPAPEEPAQTAGPDGQGEGAPAEAPVPSNMTPPQLSVPGSDPSGMPGPAGGASPDAMTAGLFTGPPSSAPVPTQKPAPPKPSDTAGDLKPVRTLFSARDTGETLATVAMSGIPRGVRAGQLCSSELSAQLQNGSPAYNPDVLPAPKLPNGTVLEARNIGFRAKGHWHDVSFRCEVDADATKIISFSMNVGGLVPRSEWRKRGFPEF
ncbi:DUF930 domain-containing protein [Rhizobium sp. CFBP 8752]|uniref:DUF930 domain-containing protein n=1 Tax=Rhizobium sp. CFBP 8752 TaxID=2775301 RepID=UPI00177F3E90|nr:DUF930 domain-containing protein [Rhizobium sp. CFBP 8752]MBD8662687.1 DUF930 domain-containing protein [Rhizobium sp. CFBP 8752]